MKIQGLSEDQLQRILNCIHTHLPHVKVYAFGSRVSGSPRKYSDLDLALDMGKPIALSALVKIKEAISETSIPYVVDLIDYACISVEFKKIIDAHKISF